MGPRERARLASRLEDTLAHGVRRTRPSSAVPIDGPAVEVAKPLLTALIRTLRSPEVVEARGVVLCWRLLTDACSPIYTPSPGLAEDPDRLWYEVLSLLSALRPIARRATP